MKKILIAVLCIAMMLSFTACDGAKDGDNASANAEIVTGSIVFKDFGTVKFEVYPKRAQQSTLNFIYLAKKGFYDGIVVHRLVNDFVIQAGAYETGYVERTTDFDYTIVGEFAANGIENDVKHVKGTLSWARPTSFNGASTQIFICTNDATAAQLDGNYAAFGMVTDGFDVLDKINAMQTENDVPLQEIVIESVTIDSDAEFPEPDFIR
ncbi:MAG: peptidylprolyl isomerase [Clostridia bacterium]|nr:peptidylprolyl isomerase [Clostridia bacterium]